MISSRIWNSTLIERKTLNLKLFVIRYKLFEKKGMVLSSAILLGFADSPKTDEKS